MIEAYNLMKRSFQKKVEAEAVGSELFQRKWKQKGRFQIFATKCIFYIPIVMMLMLYWEKFSKLVYIREISEVFQIWSGKQKQKRNLKWKQMGSWSFQEGLFIEFNPFFHVLSFQVLGGAYAWRLRELSFAKLARVKNTTRWSHIFFWHFNF